MKQNRENPFFETYRTPFGTPPFDQIKTEQYEPAFDEGIRQLDKEVRAIADNTELPTFENTIVALERSGKLLDKVSSAFFNVLNAEADDEMIPQTVGKLQQYLFERTTIRTRKKCLRPERRTASPDGRRTSAGGDIRSFLRTWRRTRTRRERKIP